MTGRLLTVLLCIGCLHAWAAPETSGIYYEQRPGAVLPLDALFQDDTGHSRTLAAALGHTPAILVVGYFHCPALCGVTRADLMDGLSRAGLATPGAYQLVAVSIDPRESPQDAAAAKQADLARFPTPGAATGWQFLTGGQVSINRLTRAIGLHARYDDGLAQFIHPAGVVFITPAGRISSYLLGVGYQPGDLRAALARAQGGGIARAALPILLLCFHFDPTTGRYSLAILRVLRLAAVLFLLTVAAVFLLARGRPPA